MQAKPKPIIAIVGGPNGAGKSTVAPGLISELLGLTEFINADTIARGFSFNPESVSVTAGKMMLRRMDELIRNRQSFAFETTLASRLFAPMLEKVKSRSWQTHLFFFWLPDADFAVARVACRVKLGGHSVPEAVIRRRYISGLYNFFSIYQPLCDFWRVYDSSQKSGPGLIAAGQGMTPITIEKPRTWSRIKGGLK